MTIHVRCSCGVSIAARDQLAGQQIDCHTCGQAIQIPEIVAPAQPPQAGAPAGAASGAGVSKWLVGTTISTALVAAGGGALGFTLNNQVAELKQTVTGQTGQTGQLATQAQLIADEAEAKTALEGEVTALQTALQDMGQSVEEDAKAHTAELGALRTDLAAAKTQQAEHQDQLAQLQGKATKLRGEIEEAEQRIQAEIQTKADGFDKRVAELRDQVKKMDTDYQTALKDTEALEQQMTQANKDIALLTDGILAVSSQIPDTKPIWAEIAKLQTRAAQEALPWYKTVFGENGVVGDFWCAIRLDTRTGTTFVRKKTSTGALTSAWVIPSPVSAIGDPGRFDIKLTFDTGGDIHDAVMLDSHTGRIWHCDVRIPPRQFAWRPVRNFFQVNYGVNGAWRVDVDSSNASAAVPRILLTDTTQVNRTYADDFSPRNSVLPLF